MKTSKSTNTVDMSDDQIRSRAFHVLEEELGSEGVARFLRMAQKGNYGTGDYTADRHLWLKGITVEQIAEDIKHRRQKSA